ncbi:MAG TPA: hypothetical protein V6C58_06070 [Allocoleopsis sp.]
MLGSDRRCSRFVRSHFILRKAIAIFIFVGCETTAIILAKTRDLKIRCRTPNMKARSP